MILSIAGRELRSQFVSVSAWALLVVFEFATAWYFFWFLDIFTEQQGRLQTSAGIRGVTDLVAGPLLHISAWLMLLVTPLLSMRLLTEERRAHTLQLLLSAPVGITQIVLGKYLAMLGMLGIMLLLVAIMPLSLQIATDLDFGKLLAGLLGLGLVAASFAAVGVYVSTLTSQPSVAAFSTLGVLLVLGALVYMLPDSMAGEGLTARVSLMRHFDALLRGAFDSSNLAFPVLVILLFLGLSIRQLDKERQHG